jgi:hypothetical protein
LIDGDNENNGGKVTKDVSNRPCLPSFKSYFQYEEKAQQDGVKVKLGSPEWNLISKKEGQEDQSDEKEEGQPLNRNDSSHK